MKPQVNVNKKVLIIFMVLVLFLIIPIISNASEDCDLTSDKYVISQLYGYICRVKPKTPIEEFKEGFNIDKTLIAIYQDNTCSQEVSSGNIGTGMVLRYTDKETQQMKTHTISVIGDINGNGNIEQLDLNLLIKYIVDKENYKLDSISFLSADMNMDGKVDIIDLTNLIRYIVFGKMDVVTQVPVGSPTIYILNETEGVDDWYSSDVIFRIEKDTTSKIEILKNMYEITGTMTQAEREIGENEEITLTENGIYSITAYSYSIYGIKSQTSVKEIKIDKNGPEIENIQVDTENANISNIYVTGITDNESGIYQISFSKNENEYNWESIEESTFTKEVETNGTWYVAVKDKAGNITQKSIEVTNIRQKVSNVEINIEEVIGINETLELNISYLGEAKQLQVRFANEYAIEVDPSIYRSEPIEDDEGNQIGWNKTIGIKGLSEANTQIEIILEDYDGTETRITRDINIVDKEHSVAVVGNMYYPTISSAIDSINSDGTVKVLKNISENFIIPENKTIELEIGNYKITGRINNKGVLYVNSGEVYNTDETIYNTGDLIVRGGKIISDIIAIHNLNNSSVTIENGEIVSNNNNAILNYGSILINNGFIMTNSQSAEAISNQSGGEINIINAQVQALNNIAINNKGTLTLGINDSRVNTSSPIIIGKDYGIYTTGELNWFDGKIIAKEIILGDVTKLENGYLINKDIVDGTQTGTLVTPKYSVNGSKYVTLEEAINASNSGDTIELLQDTFDVSDVEISKNIILNLNGYTLTREKEIVILENGNLNIKSGEIQSTSDSAIVAYMGNLEVQDTNIQGNKYGIVQTTNSLLNIISGRVQGSIYGIVSITQTNTIILGDNNSAINLNNPVIIGEEYGIFADEGTQIYYYGGMIKGKQNPGYYAIKTPIYKDGYIMSTDIVDEYYTSKLVSKSEYKVYVKKETSIEYYKTAYSAIESVSGENIETKISFMRDVNENIVIPENTNIVLDIGNYTLTGDIINEGKLTVESGNIVDIQNTLLFNNGETYITGGSLKGSSTSSPVIYNTQKAKVIITNGNIVSENNSAIVNYGILEVKNGTIENKSQDIACIITENSGNTTINGGNITSKNNTALLGKENSTIIIGENDQQIITDSPLIKGKEYGVYTLSNFYYYDGKIYGKTSINSISPITPENYSIYTKNYDTYQISELIPLTDTIKIGDNIYSSLTEALESIETSEQVTVEILRNIDESVVIPEDTNIILEAGNYTITGRINNKGTLNIASGTIQNNENVAIYNSGALTITNGIIKGTADDFSTLYNATTGNLKIMGGEIFSENTNAIQNKGNTTISDNAYIYNSSEEYATIHNYQGANLKVTGGRITNKINTGKAITNLGTTNITGGIIEPSI